MGKIYQINGQEFDENNLMLYLTSIEKENWKYRIRQNPEDRRNEFYQAVSQVDKEELDKLTDLKNKSRQDKSFLKEYVCEVNKKPFTGFVMDLIRGGIIDENYEFINSNIQDFSFYDQSKRGKFYESIILPGGKVFVVSRPNQKEYIGHELALMWLNIHGVNLKQCIRQEQKFFTSKTTLEEDVCVEFTTVDAYVQMDTDVIDLNEKQAVAMYNIYRAICDPVKVSFEDVVSESIDLGFIDNPYYEKTAKKNGLTIECALGQGVFSYNNLRKRLFNSIRDYDQPGG